MDPTQWTNSATSWTEGVDCDAESTDARACRNEVFGPVQGRGPEERGGAETEAPNPADIERTELKHIHMYLTRVCRGTI